MQKRSPDTSAGLLRWLMAAQTGLLPTQPITAQINLGLSLWLDEKRGSRQGVDIPTALSAFSGDSGVRIMSIHKSKGLELEAVFILGVEDQTFWGDFTAERSAYFVGISRANERLYLTVSAENGRKEPIVGPRLEHLTASF